MANKFLIASSVIRRIVPPVLPPFPVSYPASVEGYKNKTLQQGQPYYAEQFWPLKIGFKENELWQLPVEPLITINGENTIIRRSVAKAGASSNVRGTVKERWSQDDHRITINGLLYNPDDDTVYPEADVQQLRKYCEAREALVVECELFKIFGIERMVVESYELPFTKGENRQEYSITAYSDKLFELFIETE